MSTSAERIFQVVADDDTVINLLVLGCTANDANHYAQTIRNSGMAVHLQTAYNPDELEHVLAEVKSDIVLVNCDADEIDFTTAIKQTREANPIVSFILLSDNPSEQLFFAAETRAQDIIRRDDYAHLIYVVSREQRNIQLQKKLAGLNGELQNTVLRCQTLTETASEPIAYIHEGMHVYANPAYVKIFKFKEPSELDGLPIMDLITKDDRLKFRATLRTLANGQHADPVQVQALGVDGSNFPITMDFSPAVVDGEACTQVIVKDMSPDANLQKRLAELANYDMDTGLYNRKYFVSSLEHTIASDAQQNHTLMLVDIGNYGDMKSKYGLDGCDALLKDITKILSDTIYDTDLLARFGEHDFTILCTPGTDSTALANRLLPALNAKIYKTGDQLMKPVFGIGIAHSQNPACASAHELLQRVHTASKQAVENKSHVVEFVVAATKEHTAQTADERLLHLIDHALATDQFKLAFQPVVSLHGNSREDYAIYVRLIDENSKILMPAEFMPTAEVGNRMAEIDRWVIRHAVKEVADKRRGGQKINLLLSLSGAGIQDDSILLWICDCLREFKAKGAWLTFQLKQNDVIRHLETVEQLVEGLKKINCRIALDHFACEQEAINLIRHLGCDFAKFAPDVSKNIATDKDQAGLLSAYNTQLQADNVKTIVTAIEEASQLTVLWKVGVDYIQGNFIQEPTDTIAYDVE